MLQLRKSAIVISPEERTVLNRWRPELRVDLLKRQERSKYPTPDRKEGEIINGILDRLETELRAFLMEDEINEKETAKKALIAKFKTQIGIGEAALIEVLNLYARLKPFLFSHRDSFTAEDRQFFHICISLELKWESLNGTMGASDHIQPEIATGKKLIWTIAKAYRIIKTINVYGTDFRSSEEKKIHSMLQTLYYELGNCPKLLSSLIETTSPEPAAAPLTAKIKKQVRFSKEDQKFTYEVDPMEYKEEPQSKIYSLTIDGNFIGYPTVPNPLKSSPKKRFPTKKKMNLWSFRG
ncbi:MAG: hypothetical protein Harvfovirus37_13 [Harvfovirus sp.]|uniref:Uncharacterized protein n=1 Tax=Harvfovirus sp. TaxID=2487768 RepID=A0A3G5A7S2_9VIRU|nr:MAG: hypothetical protein Harvfovirus37_13 [Harvfovirus sp.]